MSNRMEACSNRCAEENCNGKKCEHEEREKGTISHYFPNCNMHTRHGHKSVAQQS